VISDHTVQHDFTRIEIHPYRSFTTQAFFLLPFSGAAFPSFEQGTTAVVGCKKDQNG
jgi:hypothetical protein